MYRLNLLHGKFVQYSLDFVQQIYSPKILHMTDLGSFHLSVNVGLNLAETGVSGQPALWNEKLLTCSAIEVLQIQQLKYQERCVCIWRFVSIGPVFYPSISMACEFIVLVTKYILTLLGLSGVPPKCLEQQRQVNLRVCRKPYKVYRHRIDLSRRDAWLDRGMNDG